MGLFRYEQGSFISGNDEVREQPRPMFVGLFRTAPLLLVGLFLRALLL